MRNTRKLESTARGVSWRARRVARIANSDRDEFAVADFAKSRCELRGVPLEEVREQHGQWCVGAEVCEHQIRVAIHAVSVAVADAQEREQMRLQRVLQRHEEAPPERAYSIAQLLQSQQLSEFGVQAASNS